MSDQAADDRVKRAQARASWPVARYRLGEEPGDEVWASMTPEERVLSMWQITVDAWALAGRTIPDYDRANIPARIFRPGATVPNDDVEGF